MSNEGALANLDEDDIIRRISAGEYSAHIAPEFGVSKQALQKRIRKHPQYREAREVGCELRIDKAMAVFDDMAIQRPPLKPRDPTAEEIEAWKQEYQTWKDGLRLTMVDLARAEAHFKAIAWQAEREFPDRWGNRTTVSVNIDLGSALQQISERCQGRVIDVENVVTNVVNQPTLPDNTDTDQYDMRRV